MKKIISITVILVLAIVALTVFSCSNKNKDVNSKANKEQTSDETQTNDEVETSQLLENSSSESINIEDISESSTTLNNEDTTKTTVEEEETTKPAVKEEQTTTKPVIKEEETTKVKYTYKDMNKVMYAKSSVNVRSLPCVEGDKMGSLQKGKEVKVTGQCNETSWYRIEFGGKVAYVSNSYLVDEKPVESTMKPVTEPTENTEDFWQPTTTYDFERYTVADKVGDGLDKYRVGQFKYGVLGQQLHVLTVDESNRYGFYYATDDYSREWNDLSVGLQDLLQDGIFGMSTIEEYWPLVGQDTYFPEFEAEIENDKEINNFPYYEGFMYVSILFAPEETKNYDFVFVDNTKEARDILIYGLINALYTNKYVSSNRTFYEDTRLYKGTESLEDILIIEGFTYEEYSNGKKLAEKYGIDFHGYIESVKEIVEDNKVHNKEYGIE